MTAGRLTLQGARDCVPMLIGLVPFAIIAGAMAREVGFGVGEAMAVSLVVFAGAAQLASLELLSAGAPKVVIVATALLVNLRFALYSASLAPHFRCQPRALRGAMAGLLTDQAYALSISRFQTLPPGPLRVAYFFGAALPLWIVWQLGSLAGALLGGRFASDSLLGLAVPFCFLALLVPHLATASQLVAAASAATALVALQGAPAGVDLMLAVAIGLVAGGVVERWTR